MPTLRCTRKLLNLLGAKPADLAPATALGGPDDDWFANLFHVEGRKCVLVTHATTLFSFVRMDVRKADLIDLEGFFRDGLRQALRIHRLDGESAMRALKTAQPLALARTNSRSVLGSMKEIIENVQSDVWMRGGLAHCPTEELIVRVNDIPMGALGYEYSIDRLNRLVTARQKA